MIAALGNDAFLDLAFMIESLPKVVRHPDDLHEDLVRVPTPVTMGAQRFDTFAPDLGGEMWSVSSSRQASGPPCPATRQGPLATLPEKTAHRSVSLRTLNHFTRR
jgi:hypothetical protein